MQSAHLSFASWLTDLLDNKFSVAGFKFGLDPLFNFIPVLGPIVTFGLSLYLLWIARHVGVPASLLATMTRNIFIDFVLGLIPVVGTIGDFVFRANHKNLQILRQWMEQEPAEGEVINARKISSATT